VSDTHSSTNQARTEPVPPTEGHDVPGPGVDRADAGAGTATSPGPREGSPASLADPGVPSIAREGLADGETDNRTPPTSTL
jgi:hypothetical protein